MSASISELEDEVAVARSRLDHTLEAIQGRLTLSGIVDEVMGNVSRSQVSTGMNGALSLVRRNPLPMMIVAAGVGWLIHRMNYNRQVARLDGLDFEPELPLLNVGHSRVYDPDASSRHPAQDSLESRRDIAAQA